MKISVITPSYNQGEYLGETLDSVREAARRAAPAEIEHLVIDGGSSDGTLEVLRGQTDARWVSEPDRGQADAINKGFAKSSGEVLCWLCSDDLWEPRAAERVARAFAENPEIDLVYGDAFFLEGRSGWKRLKPSGPFSVGRLMRRNFLAQPSTFWRRGVYERFGGLDDSLHFCLDHEYWLRICRGTRWLYIPEALSTMRLHSGAKTSRALAAAWWEAARMGRRCGASRALWVDALWMQVFGQHFYRLKRSIFERVGARRTRSGSPAS